MNSWMQALEYLVWFTQLGLNLLLPPVLCMLAASWLISRFGLPLWVYIPALVLGLCSGGMNFWRFAQTLLKRSRGDASSRNFASNRHH